MRVGLFGGTFDPPHLGHLIVAQDAALALELDRILFIPAAQPPHKQQLVVTPAPLRAHMLQLAIAGDRRFSMDRIELERAGPSYTVDTLRELRERDPGIEWTLLIGADQYRELHTWRDPEQVRLLARLGVLTRAGSHAAAGEAASHAAAHEVVYQHGSSPEEAAQEAAAPEAELPSPLPGTGVEELAAGAVRVAVSRIDISSTLIRARVAAGLPIRYLVPDAVEGFILEQRLYGRNGSVVAGYDPGHTDIRG